MISLGFVAKRCACSPRCSPHHYSIAATGSREQKLDIITGFGSHQSVPWQTLEPNDHHDWINQRSGDFGSFVPLNDANDAVFLLRSSGVQTNRDNWAYNASPSVLADNMEKMIYFYNHQLTLHRDAIQSASSSKDREKMAGQLIDANPRKIKWTRSLIAHLARGREGTFESRKIGKVAYRPYCQSWLYYDPQFNEYYKEKLYPTSQPKNLAIQATGAGGNKEFSCLISDLIFDVQTLSNGQCFPLYWYEKAGEKKTQSGFQFEQEDDASEIDGYIRRDGVSDVALTNFRKHYADQSITKEDVFYYVYGVLHSPAYREQYSADLKKVLPRVPFAPDFRAFEDAGRLLAELHLNYESIEPWPVIEEAKDKGDLNDSAYYRVEKMRFASAGGREKDKSVIVFNGRITLKGIPAAQKALYGPAVHRNPAYVAA